MEVDISLHGQNIRALSKTPDTSGSFHVLLQTIAVASSGTPFLCVCACYTGKQDIL